MREAQNAMELKLTTYIFQRMLTEYFHTKRNMAERLGISLGKLSEVWESSYLTDGCMEAMDCLLYYCARERVPLDAFMPDFH